jgi:acyl carrier protein
MRRGNGHQPTDTSARRQVRQFIEANFLYLEPELELADEDDLLGLGVVDSLGFVELVEEVQGRFGISIQDVEITEENFGSIDAIVAFIETKRAS